MSALREPDLLTVEDFFSLVEDGQKADLIDGVIYMASPDTPRNNEIASFVQVLMTCFAAVGELGKVYVSRVAFVMSEFRAPEPDVAFVSAARLGLVSAGRVKGAPDIAVEVVSHDSRSRDYVEKKRLYEQAGVREYWLIDPLQERAEFYLLRDGAFVRAPLSRNRIFRSEALPGFWLDVEWLFADPMPNHMTCLQQILAGEPEG
jgi:Uma2 family endonuclease